MKEIIGKPNFKIKKLRHRIVIDEKKKYFSKVFDTMNYKILIRKLKKYGMLSKLLETLCMLLRRSHTLKRSYMWCPQGSILSWFH